MKSILSITFFLIAFSSNAAIVSWSGSGTSSTGWSIDVTVEIEQSDFVAGAELVSLINFWEASWNDGTTFLSIGSETGRVLDFSSFIVDSLFDVSFSNLCSSPCTGIASGLPDFGVTASPTFGAWDASTDEFGGCCVAEVGSSSTFSWNTGMIKNVPEPSVLGLLGFGLTILVIRRRLNSADS